MEKHDTDAQHNLEPFPSNVAHDVNDVLMDPIIFHQASKQLTFKPSVDLFATADHHQVERYFATQRDANSSAINAVPVDWRRKGTPTPTTRGH